MDLKPVLACDFGKLESSPLNLSVPICTIGLFGGLV